jgi:hypothetical protein
MADSDKGRQPEPPNKAEEGPKRTENEIQQRENDARVHGLVHMFISSKAVIRIKGTMDLEISIDERSDDEK